MEKYKVGVIGCTGMVGQRFISLIENHPWFELTAIAASSRSAGKTYGEAAGKRWAIDRPFPEKYRDMVIRDADADKSAIAQAVDFVFCAVDMPKDEILALEEAYARLECPVVSNNSANRWTPDVPMVIPEVNPEHIAVIDDQRRRLGTKRGFIAVKSNCSIMSYVPALTPLRDFGIQDVLVCTYQAISGAGKTFDRFPEILDNVIPYIGGEEEKSEQEPLKIWGEMNAEGTAIVPASAPVISAQCIRVPVSDGHIAAVSVSFDRKPDRQTILDRWASYRTVAQQLALPSAPTPFVRYMEEQDRPQTKLDRDFEHGMGISVGRLREDAIFDYKFVCLSHNTLRGAAGGGVLSAELLCAQGYIERKE